MAVVEPLLNAEMIHRLEQLTLLSRKLSTGRLKGERRSRRRGSSNEFADYRNYVPGDDLRFLDWKIYGRLERLFIKLFLEEEDLRVNILVDASGSMQYGAPQKLLYAKRIAAALGYMCLAKMDSLVARSFGDGLDEAFGPKRGKYHGAAYFDFLQNLRTADGTSLYRSLKSFSQIGGRGMTIVISDFYDMEGYQDGLRQLFSGNYEVLVFHVLSPQELKPEFTGDIRIVDQERDDLSTDVSIGPHVLNLYDRTLKVFCNGIKEYIVGHGGAYLLASTDTPFERLVLDALRRRGVVR